MSRVVIETMPPLVKGRRLSAEAPAPAPDDSGVVFDAILFPNRSLPNAGFVVLMSVVIGANLTIGLYYYLIGAWPILGFCGLDVFAVWLAFKLSYRQGRMHERVRVTADALWVSRVLPSGHETRWRLQPYWTRIAIDDPVVHESQIRLISQGKVLVVGSFLSPKERGELGAALKDALMRARTA